MLIGRPCVYVTPTALYCRVRTDGRTISLLPDDDFQLVLIQCAVPAARRLDKRILSDSAFPDMFFAPPPVTFAAAGGCIAFFSSLPGGKNFRDTGMLLAYA